MSFSIGAQGTKSEVVNSLSNQPVYGILGAKALQLVTEAVESSPAKFLNGEEVWFKISAHGHSYPGNAPSLRISVETCAKPWEDKEPSNG